MITLGFNVKKNKMLAIFGRVFLGVSLGFPLLLSAADDNLANKIWISLEKVEQKLNQGLPKRLAPDLWVEKVLVDRANHLVRYEGVIKNRTIEDLSSSKLVILKSRAQNNTTQFLCGQPASKNFLKLLSMVEGRVQYIFFYEDETQSLSEWFHFFVTYQDCITDFKV